MTDERTLELMHGEIDGTNSAEESAKLGNLLTEDSETRDLYRELCEIDGALRGIEKSEPPPGLKESILSSVGEMRRRAPEEDRYFAARITPRRISLRRFIPARPAYALATGILLGMGLCAATGILLLRADPGMLAGSDRTHRPYGTIVGSDAGGRLLNSQCIALEFGEIYGGACVEHTENAVQVHLGISSQDQVQIIFQYDEEVRFEGYSALDEGTHTIEVRANEAELTHVGDCDYSLVFKDGRRAGSPIRMRVLHSGNLLFEKSITPDEG